MRKVGVGDGEGPPEEQERIVKLISTASHDFSGFLAPAFCHCHFSDFHLFEP